MTPRRITVGDIITEHRRSYPGKLALADGEHHLTWPELDERVNRLASALRGTGVGPGDRILWLGQNSFRVYELLGAAAKIGAMVCPGYWRWAPPEMAFAIEDFSPKVVIWQEEEIGSTSARRGPSARPPSPRCGCATIPGPGTAMRRSWPPATRLIPAWTSTRIPRCWSSTPRRSAAGRAARCCRTPT